MNHILYKDKSEGETLNFVNLTKNKKSNFYINKRIKYFKRYLNIFFFHGLFILSYYLYYLSLEKCYKGFDACGLKMKWLSIKLSEAIISSIILAILIECMFYKIISFLNILHIIIYYFIIYKYSHGLEFHDHGFYNFVGCFVIVFLIILFIIPLNGLICLLKKRKRYAILIYFGIFIFFILLVKFIIIKNYMNCNDWPKGLNNTFIKNDLNIYPCKIIFPKTCSYKFGSYFMDITKWQNTKCKGIKIERERLFKSKYNFINKTTKRIGIPLSNKNKELFLAVRDNNHSIFRYVLNNLVDMDNKNLVNKVFGQNIPELIVDFNKSKKGELIINLKYNETLSKERKLLEKNSVPYSDNIMVIYIDSVSRANSIRKLKKTLKFFEKFMSYNGGFNPKYPSENYHSFQFFKYHTLLPAFTRINYLALFYGNYYQSVSDKYMVRISKYFKENGYLTGFINDMCLREPTNTNHILNSEEICDHEMLICDQNMQSVHSHTKRCLYNNISNAYVYEYANQFWRKYKNNRKFLMIITNDGHEGTLEVLKYIDNALFSFLNNLYNKNLFKDSTIFLLSDHGSAAPSPYYINNFYRIERHLPMLYIICNDRKNISYNQQYEHIHKNQQILVTAYDIYNTFGYLMLGDKYKFVTNKTKEYDTPKSKYGKSLFDEINPKDRMPKNYDNMTLDICI